MRKLTVGSLFAGIGGLELGLEMTGGFETVWQVERDEYARRVLERHWPNARRWYDVTTFPPDADDETKSTLRVDAESRNWVPCVQDSNGDWFADVICGGFPCQPHSHAGKRLASADERDLWGEFARVVRCLRPRWVVAENVPGLLSSESGRFFGRVLSDLAALGYDAEWESLSAAAFGAPHIRDRVFIIAQHDGGEPRYLRKYIADEVEAGRMSVYCESADPTGERCTRKRDQSAHSFPGPLDQTRTTRWKPTRSRWWATEPNVGRVAHGVSNRVDRLRCLGNAVVPQVAQWIGQRILDSIDQNGG